MYKKVLLVILTTSILFAGCNKDQVNVNEPEVKAIEQAIVESGIDTGNIIFTEKIKGENAFSIYEKKDEYGIIHYVKSDKGWQYRGASGFGHRSSEKNDLLTFGISSWLLGDYSLNGKNQYNTVFIGEVHQRDIARVFLESDHERFRANIVAGVNKKFWYHLSDADNAHSLIKKISGYSSDGYLIYEEYLSLPH